MPKKEPVPIVNQRTSNMMDLRQITNNVSVAEDVESILFGNVLMSKNVMSFLGFASGFKKAIPSEDSQNSRDTAPLKSSKSKTIGLCSFQSTTPTSPKSNISFMTALISEETTALSLS